MADYCDNVRCFEVAPCAVHGSAPLKCGGFMPGAREATDEVQALCDQIRGDALQKAQASGWNGLFTEFKAIEFTTQVVAGTNFLVKVQTSSKPSYIHVKIHRPLPHSGKAPSLMSVEVNKAREDPLA